MQDARVPRNAGRLLASLLVVLAVLLGSLGTPAGASTATQWSKAYCSSLDALDTASTDTTNALRPIDPIHELAAYLAAVKQGLIDLQRASTSAVAALKKAGKPKVKQGDGVQKGAVAAFEEANRVATEGIAGLDRGDLAGQTGAIRALVGARQPVTEFHSTVLQQAITKDKKFAKAFAKACT